MNVETLNQMQGSYIKSLTGIVMKMWPRKSGDGQYGPYSFQNGDLKLDSGEVVKLSIKNMDDMKHLVSKRVTFNSAQGEKGLHGVKVGSYNNNVQIEIDGRAEIEQFNSDASAGPASQPARQSAPARAATPPPSEVGGDPLIVAKRFIARNMSLTKLAVSALAVMQVEYAETYGIPMSPQMQVAVLNSLLFGATQAGIVDHLPFDVKLVSVSPPAPPPQQENDYDKLPI